MGDAVGPCKLRVFRQATLSSVGWPLLLLSVQQQVNISRGTPNFILVRIIQNFAIICSPYVNQRFGGKYHLHLQRRKSSQQEISVHQVARHD
jgi:hypothetical protein